jgi:hypothetical protein
MIIIQKTGLPIEATLLYIVGKRLLPPNLFRVSCETLNNDPNSHIRISGNYPGRPLDHGCGWTGAYASPFQSDPDADDSRRRVLGNGARQMTGRRQAARPRPSPSGLLPRRRARHPGPTACA